MAKTSNKKYSATEIVFIVISGLFILAGLTLAILSIIGDYLGAGNWIRQAEQSMVNIFKWNVSWRFYGLVIGLIGCIILVIDLWVSSKRADRTAANISSKSERVQINLDAIKKAEQVEEKNTEAA